MGNSQILTIALAAVPNMLAVLAGILINNSRLNDTHARISDLRAHVDHRFDEMRDYGARSFIAWNRSLTHG